MRLTNNVRKKKVVIIIIAVIAIIGISVSLILIVSNNKSNNTVNDIDPVDAEAYFKENGEIVSIVDAAESKAVTSEKETYDFLKERGFTDYAITTSYLIDGSYYDETEIDDSSSEKHPMYSSYYVNSNGDLWTIEIINGCLTAYPVSYIEQSSSEIPIVFAETDTVYSYDSVTNKFYETIPKDTAMTVKKIDKIDSAALDQLTKEGIDKL